MSGLQVFNAVVTAAGAALGLVMGVVCVIYAYYVAEVPRLQDEFVMLLLLSAGFWSIAGAAALAFVAHRRQASWRWLVQPLPTVPLAGIVAYLWLAF